MPSNNKEPGRRCRNPYRINTFFRN